MGVNQFTDLLDSEFKAIYLTLQVPSDIEIKHGKTYNNIESNLRGDIDWVDQGKVSPVKNQGACGSCWAFSANAALESAYRINRNDVDNPNFSEQELVDCSRAYGNQGCNGGWMDSAFQYVHDKSIHTTTAYPYKAVDQSCTASQKSGPTYTLSKFIDVPQGNCNELLNSLSSRPLSVAVDASNWSSYRSGVLSSCGSNVNHGVLLVGATDAYWRIKNSWAASWGEQGFIRLGRGNTCAICNYASYPVL